MSDGVRFIRKNGKVIPIRAAAGAAAATGAHVAGKLAKLHKSTRFAHGAAVGAGAAIAAHHGTLKSTHPDVKVKKNYDVAGLGLSIASGVVGAATFAGGPKGLAAGFAASHVLDGLGIGANIASVTGKGHKVDRAKQGAKQEARNFIVGNAVYGLGLIALKKNRAAAVGYASATLSFARKILRVGGE